MSKLYRVEGDGAIVVTTSSGWEVECQPVADLLLRVGQNLVEPEPPTVPTYTVTGAGGETDQRPYDQEAIDDPSTPDEDRERWAAYLDARADYDAEMDRVETRRNEMRGRFMALRGAKITAGIMRASGLAQEALDQIETTFLDSMGYGNGADAEGDPGVSDEDGS